VEIGLRTLDLHCGVAMLTPNYQDWPLAFKRFEFGDARLLTSSLQRLRRQGDSRNSNLNFYDAE
jgi:hypothetical protein